MQLDPFVGIVIFPSTRNSIHPNYLPMYPESGNYCALTFTSEHTCYYVHTIKRQKSKPNRRNCKHTELGWFSNFFFNLLLLLFMVSTFNWHLFTKYNYFFTKRNDVFHEPQNATNSICPRKTIISFVRCKTDFFSHFRIFLTSSSVSIRLGSSQEV